MSLASFLFGSTLLVLMPGDAQSPIETVKVELRTLMTDLNSAHAARDRVALERIYAPEFVFIHALGGPIDRKAHIDAAVSAAPGPPLPIPSFDGLLVYGDAAILRTPVEGRFGTTIYAKRDGRWQIVQLQGTVTPPSKPAAVVATETLRAYEGRYHQADNGMNVSITVDGDRLSLQVEGRQKLPLTAESGTKFTLPGGAGSIEFLKTAGGGMAYEVTRPNGVKIRGTRVP